MKYVADLITADPFCLERGANLKDAHDLMRAKNVRHIPLYLGYEFHQLK